MKNFRSEIVVRERKYQENKKKNENRPSRKFISKIEEAFKSALETAIKSKLGEETIKITPTTSKYLYDVYNIIYYIEEELDETSVNKPKPLGEGLKEGTSEYKLKQIIDKMISEKDGYNDFVNSYNRASAAASAAAPAAAAASI